MTYPLTDDIKKDVFCGPRSDVIPNVLRIRHNVFDADLMATLSGNIKDDSGKLRKFINVYVNDEDIRFLGGDAHQFEDGDEIMLIPSIAGGHCGQRRWLALPYCPELL